MKIALVSEEFPPFMVGGIATNCYDLAYSLSKKKIFTSVFCGKSDVVSIHEINDYLQIVRLPCLDFPPRYLWFQLQNLGKLSKYLRDYTIIHGVKPIASTISAYLATRMGKPFVLTHHHHHLEELKVFLNSSFSEWSLGSMSDSALSYPVNDFLIKECLRRSKHVIVPGLYTLDYMKKIYKDLDYSKFSIIYNGINFEKMPNNPVQIDFSVLFYGQLIERKGILYLIKAMAIVAKEFPKVRFRIFGKGPLEKKIRTMIQKLGLENITEIGGHVPYPKLLQEIKKAAVVALPSYHEVGPFIAALEAMAFKKPVIAFDFSFTRELVSNMQNGILVKPGNIKELAENIILLLSDKDLREKLGQEAYCHVKSKHNWMKLVDRYIEIYQNCAAS
jgi:glycosyltransferase involved in cell wall biosynthesis